MGHVDYTFNLGCGWSETILSTDVGAREVDLPTKLQFVSSKLDPPLPASDQDLSQCGQAFFYSIPFAEDVIHLYVGGCYVFKYLLDDSIEVVG